MSDESSVIIKPIHVWACIATSTLAICISIMALAISAGAIKIKAKHSAAQPQPLPAIEVDGIYQYQVPYTETTRVFDFRQDGTVQYYQYDAGEENIQQNKKTMNWSLQNGQVSI
jgi:hypothetical protein